MLTICIVIFNSMHCAVLRSCLLVAAAALTARARLMPIPSTRGFTVERQFMVYLRQSLAPRQTRPHQSSFMQRVSLPLLILLACLGAGSAEAGCSNPAGNEADIIYNVGYHTYQFCNGTNWIAFGGAGGGVVSALGCGGNTGSLSSQQQTTITVTGGCAVTFKVWGAGAGGGSDTTCSTGVEGTGGGGGYATITVTPSVATTYYLVVGGKGYGGSIPTSGGTGGAGLTGYTGGAGGSSGYTGQGGGGGAASGVWTGSYGGTPVVVAGGGAGGSAPNSNTGCGTAPTGSVGGTGLQTSGTAGASGQGGGTYNQSGGGGGAGYPTGGAGEQYTTPSGGGSNYAASGGSTATGSIANPGNAGDANRPSNAGQGEREIRRQRVAAATMARSIIRGNRQTLALNAP